MIGLYLSKLPVIKVVFFLQINMFSKLALNLRTRISISSVRHLARLPSVDDEKDPLQILKHGLVDGRLDRILPCPRECDVLIVGGESCWFCSHRLLSQHNLLFLLIHRRSFVVLF